MSTAQERIDALGFNEVSVFHSAKRCGMQWTPWMGDWFTSLSPRNGNNNAEGTWEHWVALAIDILRHDFTGLVAPEAHAVAMAGLKPMERYSETERNLTADELAAGLLQPVEANPS